MQVAVAPVSSIDIVKVRGEYEREALYFFDNNWKNFRDEAKKSGFISGFEWFQSGVDSTGVATIILVTHYGDSVRYGEREKNFGEIIKKVSPGRAEDAEFGATKGLYKKCHGT